MSHVTELLPWLDSLRADIVFGRRGVASVRSLTALLYQVSATDPAMLAIPATIILGTSAIAAAPAIVRAIRVDPIEILRAEEESRPHPLRVPFVPLRQRRTCVASTR